MTTSSSLVVRIQALVIAIFLLPSLAFGATNLGGGYSCDDGKITKKGKVVKLSVARSAVDLQISKLPNTKSGKAKRAVLQALKKALKDCTNQTSGGGGTTVSAVLSSKVLGDSFLQSTAISGFGSSPAYALLQIKEVAGSYTLSISIGENTPLSERYFADYEPGPFLQLPASAKIPYSASLEVGAPSMRSILLESNKVTFRWTNIKPGTTRNGTNITEVRAVLVLATMANMMVYLNISREHLW